MFKMKTETLAYKMQPAGHDAPQPKRKYSQPDKKLELVLEKFLSRIDKVDESKKYKLAKDLLKNVEASVDEMHSLIVKYQDHRDVRRIGDFVSVVYNKSPEKIIVYDFDIPIDFLAGRLSKDKIFINRGSVGFSVGHDALGALVNQNLTYSNFGIYASGPIINYGLAGNPMGDRSCGLLLNLGEADIQLGGLGGTNSGVLINMGKLLDLGVYSQGLVINQGKCNVLRLLVPGGPILLLRKIPTVTVQKDRLTLQPAECKKIPELVNYLNNLKQKFAQGKSDYHKILPVLDELGPEPHIKIKNDIEGILSRAGYL